MTVPILITNTCVSTCPPSSHRNASRVLVPCTIEIRNHSITLLSSSRTQLSSKPHGAQHGEERNIIVTLQLLDNLASYTYTVCGQVGGDWILVRDPKKIINRQQWWPASTARGELLTQLLKEARAERKAKRKQQHIQH